MSVDIANNFNNMVICTGSNTFLYDIYTKCHKGNPCKMLDNIAKYCTGLRKVQKTYSSFM